MSGTVQGHSDGFGFVLLDTKGDDLFLPEAEMTKVFDGDRVLVKSIERDRRGKKIGTHR